MKILVTGYKGFIGQNMVKELQKDGHELLLYEWGDGYVPLYGVDRVVHLGAISSTTYTNIPQILKQNYYFTTKLIKDCDARGIPIQFSSSASLYGTNNNTFCEDDPLDPKTPYAWTKLLVENFVDTKYFSIPIQIFRYFNVYGPHEEHKGSQASPYCQFTKQAKETKTIKVFEGSDGFYRDFIHVDKVIEVHKKFFDISVSGVWNVGTGECKSFMDVAIEISDQYNAKIEQIPMPDNLLNSYQKFTKANLDKLNSTLGIA